ncbi:TRAP transporter large permease [Bradyrhizobium sp.]|uniref:TRAP transporter large permease n=1 Tax=Bradyrhizobium sp. TaxID=376 RepID=UPI003C737C80
MIILMFAVFLGLVILGAPILAAMGLGASAAFIGSGLSLAEVARSLYGGISAFTLLSIPLFIFVGFLLDNGGMSLRLVKFVIALVGWLAGGLGISVVGATMLFSGISGSVNADAAAIGSVMIPMMVKAGYRSEWSAAIVAAAAGTGILIPPSITMIVLGTIVNLSIKQLFLASLIPAVLLGTAKAVIIYIRAKTNVEPSNERIKFSLTEVLKTFVEAVPALLAPAIILGGILLGIFTATEAAAVAVLYTFLLTVVIYRSISIAEIPSLLLATVRLTGVVVGLVGVASAIAYIFAYNQASDALVDWAGGYADHYLSFVAIVMVLFWILGALMDGIPALVILMPLFMPLAERAGMSALHFAIFSLAIFGISLVTPPIGTACFVVSAIAKLEMRQLFHPMLPFIVAMFATILILAYFPEISLALPRAIGGYVGR